MVEMLEFDACVGSLELPVDTFLPIITFCTPCRDFFVKFIDGVYTSFRKLHHVWSVDAEEDVKDFRPLRPGLDPSEIVVLFLCPK